MTILNWKAAWINNEGKQRSTIMHNVARISESAWFPISFSRKVWVILDARPPGRKSYINPIKSMLFLPLIG